MAQHPSNQPLQGTCRVCSGILAKEVTTIEQVPIGTSGEMSSTVTMIETMDYYGYVNPPLQGVETKSVTGVWCTACGLMYNPQ